MKRAFFIFLIITFMLVGFSSAISPTFSTNKTEKEFSIGWVGDMVPASSDEFNKNAFSGVKSYTQVPSLMIGNLEGTFAKEARISKCEYLSNNCHAFRGNDSFAYALKDAGFDFVSLVNNHSYDYGSDGLLDTEEILIKVGIPFVSQTNPSTIIDSNGKKVGILGVSSTPPRSTITDYDFIKTEIQKLKQQADIVILIFHGGAEGSNKTSVPGEYEYLGNENRGNVEMTAKVAIDAGADIVLGAGPHVLRKIEYYKDRPIVYSAGNFVGGNEKLLTAGNLGVSSIFNLFEKNSFFKTSLTSVILSKQGIPEIDPLEQARYLVESLSEL